LDRLAQVIQQLPQAGQQRVTPKALGQWQARGMAQKAIDRRQTQTWRGGS
jgi:hypothetical protein